MAEETVRATPAAEGGTPSNVEGAQTGAAQEKTFTQAQVDAIVGDRLAREREKYKDYDALKQNAERHKDYDELVRERDSLKAAAQVRDIRDRVAAEKGIPASLLTGDTEDACRAQAEQLMAWKGQTPAYPETGDGGAPGKFSGGSTRDQFASWFQES